MQKNLFSTKFLGARQRAEHKANVFSKPRKIVSLTRYVIIISSSTHASGASKKALPQIVSDVKNIKDPFIVSPIPESQNPNKKLTIRASE
jgi:hypothetical protein